MNPVRKDELEYLNQAYAAQGSTLIILYGQAGIGKTTLLSDFSKDKECFYYSCACASERQQQYLISRQIRMSGARCPDYPSWDEITDALKLSETSKKVIIFDEFDHLVRNDTGFMPAITELIGESLTEYLIILCSSQVGFIENQLVSKIGSLAFSISGFLKVRPLGFSEFSGRFSDYSVTDRILAYSILGGVAGNWIHFDPRLSVKENIIKSILSPNGGLFDAGRKLLSDSVREPAVYSSILSAIAEGKDKLGDIYDHTQFSRAKISVYLKNLMELELAEKEFSIDVRGRDNLRKGIYKVSDPFIRFYFTFIYPNMSILMQKSPESFYDEVLSDNLDIFAAETFSQICREYMEQLAEDEAFGFEVDDSGIFDGKEGFIDYLGINEYEKQGAAAFCCYEMNYMPYEYFERALRVIESTKTKVSMIYLFSKAGFDEKINLEAKMHDNIKLFAIKDWLE